MAAVDAYARGGGGTLPEQPAPSAIAPRDRLKRPPYSTSFPRVSGKKSAPMIVVPSATTMGYHRP
jgi:hypothetical protein